MRPTFLGFETARKGIMASQKALDLTGHNIANVNTEGYSRQRLDVFSAVTTGGGLKYSNAKIANAGQGVYAGGVDQIRDPFLDKRFRELNSDTAEAGIKSGILVDIENVLDNIDTEGLQNAMLNFQSNMSAFATDSTDRPELANILTQSAKQLVSILNTYDSKLTQVYDQTKYEIDSSISDVNATLDKIAELNKEIVDSYVSSGEITSGLAADYTVNASYGPNELLDARNVLIDSLSTYGDLEALHQKDGSITVKFSGATVVEGDKATQLSYREDAQTGALIMSFNNGEDYNPTSGSLKGYVDLFNGNGCYAESAQNGNEGIPYYQTAIDKFAEAVAREFNAMNVDLNDPTTERPLFVSSDGGAVTAGNMRIADSWLDDPMSIIPTTQEGELDNAHMFKLLSVFDKDVTFGDMGDFDGTFEEYISYYTNNLAAEIQFQDGKYDSSQTLTTNILTARDNVSGVSIDEEGINMMNFQKWYNASARLMTTLDEALNTIINSMGLVGR